MREICFPPTIVSVGVLQQRILPRCIRSLHVVGETGIGSERAHTETGNKDTQPSQLV